ncbi:hypothetical protein [Pseudomonas songnenensis]|uniref:Uncharacterized protein n=1 Tax=Pseudomonas songnenensis TaxID=1176259 RepID=A0A482U538_9PSED|nr:hypothetical protein [Pseudomonas songnenensis]RYJ63253.1 hypothetical protein EJA06_004690 [Pseudomonas songnenensis]
MQFINNWSRPVTLAAGATSLALDLPDGEYRLTIADSQFTPTRWEIVSASVASGTATLARGLEGTSDQDWPTDSIIYCTVTAGLLADLFSRLTSAEAAISALDARVTALEPVAPSNLRIRVAFDPATWNAEERFIDSISAYSGGVEAFQLNLDGMTSDDNSAYYTGTALAFGSVQATCIIDTATVIDAGWDEIRIAMRNTWTRAAVITLLDDASAELGSHVIEAGTFDVQANIAI